MKRKIIRRITYQDVCVVSGELLRDTIEYESKPFEIDPRNGNRSNTTKELGYMLAIQKKMFELVVDEELTGLDYKVYLLMCSKLDWYGMLRLNQTEVAKEANISRAALSRSINRFVRKGILIKGKGHQYQINADYGFKGANPERVVIATKQKTELSIVK